MNPQLLQQALAYGALALAVLGGVSALCTFVGPALDRVAKPGSRLDHFAKALTGVGVDVGKVRTFLAAALGRAPAVLSEVQALDAQLQAVHSDPQADKEKGQ